MLVVRIGLLVLYVGGMALLSRYLRGRLPVSTGGSMLRGPTSANVILWIWGPTLWVVPGLLWLGILNLPLGMVLVLCVLLPLCEIALFLWLSRAMAGTALVFVLLATLVVLFLALTTPELYYTRFVLFVVSLMAPPLLSIWLLATWAPRVAPLPDTAERRISNALALLLGFFTGGPKSTWVVEDGYVRTRIAGNPWLGAGPGLLMTEPENVVVLKSGSEIARVAGPGVVLLERSEMPYRVVDLRDQARGTRITTITRDGIEVRAPVSALFRVNRGNREVRLGEAWPYRSQGDVLQALFAEEVDPAGHSVLDAHTAHPWEDLPAKLAAHKLEQALSFYSLDQLYGGVPDDAEGGQAIGTAPPTAVGQGTSTDAHIELLKTHRRLESALGLPLAASVGDSLTRLTISRLGLRAVRKALEPRGFDIHDAGINGSIEPLSHGVTEQRVEAWKSRFMAKVVDWQAELERKRAMALSKIRQEAREKLLSEMIEEASKRLTVTDSEARRDFVAYTMLSSLIRIAASPEVQRQLPDSALPTLEHLYEQVSDLSEPEEEI
ncbi:MAG: V-type proton ATPase subunit E [Anaerolineae bacterium]|jgi:hypothetical protein|nr:V-type proton ATPase subunit E [Anaerolineae bacterium]